MKKTCRPELLTDGGKLKFYVPLMSSPPQPPEDLYQTTAAAGGEEEGAREPASPAALEGIPASRSFLSRQQRQQLAGRPNVY